MSNNEMFWIAAAILFIACIIAVYCTEKIEQKTVRVPKHVPIGESDAFTAQEVFDWVVYVTKVTGKDYLEQLNWKHTFYHSHLFASLRSVLNTESEAQRLQRFKAIGRSFKLDTSIVDSPV